MRHIRELAAAHVTRPTLLTIGAFDGVHRGHQALIARLVDAARAAGQMPAVLTFDPHPRMVIRGWVPGYYLTLPDEKAELLGRYGIELVVTHPFDDRVRHARARDFVAGLKRHLDLAGLWVGPDFALGYQREGDVAFLHALGAELGYALHVIEHKESHAGEPISSGRIRDALAAGDSGLAAELLGRPYALAAQVVAGQQRGRTIGIPTANLAVPVERVIPARGVYVTWAGTAGGRHASVTNIGVRPTFDGQSAVTVEAHLLDFDGDLYGQTLELEFVERLRDERRFAGVAELVAQIHADIAAARAFLAGTRGAPSQGAPSQGAPSQGAPSQPGEPIAG